MAIAIPESLFIYSTQTHFDDLDGLWVLHHSKYLVFLERAVMALFYKTMQTEVFDPEKFPDLYQVVRNVDIHYMKPIDGVFAFHIVLRVERVREAGLVLRFAFVGEAGEVFARGLRTSCKLSKRTHHPAGWTEVFRKAYEARVVDTAELSEHWRKVLGIS